MDCIEKLVSLSVDPNEQVLGDDSVLHIACRQGHFAAADLLLVAKADPNRQSKRGWTPAHYAAAAGDLDIIEILHDDGADLSIRNANDKTARDVWASMFPDQIEEFDACIRDADANSSSDAKPAPVRHHVPGSSRNAEQFSAAGVVTRLKTFPKSQISIKVPSSTSKDHILGHAVFHIFVSCGAQCTWTKSFPAKDFRQLYVDLVQEVGRPTLASCKVEPPKMMLLLGAGALERQREVSGA